MTRLEKINSFLNDEIFLLKASKQIIEKFEKEKEYLEIQMNEIREGFVKDFKEFVNYKFNFGPLENIYFVKGKSGSLETIKFYLK